MKHQKILFVSVAAVLSLLTNDHALSRELTFEDRVKVQAAIERVYWSHRIWPKENTQPKPPLSEVLGESALRRKVEDYLKKSNALEAYWNRPITSEQLQSEMERMARSTQSPEVLRELFDALGSDAFLIAECVARPSLVERLMHTWYSQDERFHGDLRRRIKTLLLKYKTVADMKQLGGNYEEATWRLDRQAGERQGSGRHNTTAVDGETAAVDRGVSLGSGWGTADHLRGKPLDSPMVSQTAVPISSSAFRRFFGPDDGTVDANDDYDSLRPVEVRDDLEGVLPGTLSGLKERGDSFSLSAILEKKGDYVGTATVTWSKVSSEAWWQNVRSSISREILLPGTSYSYAAPVREECDDVWRPMGDAAPDPRHAHIAIWTGSEMIVWGGRYRYGYDFGAPGGRYDPTTDTWSLVSSGPNAPAEVRSYATAVWTGNEMIVWGGKGSVANPNGGRYDPLSNTWIPMNTSSGPGTYDHTAVWTGQEMIIWGGVSVLSGSYSNRGARYSPKSDTWTQTSTGPGVPSPRARHTAVWTGSEMIICGGSFPSGSPLTNGRYDPTTDSWPTMAPLPNPKVGHTAVWTGSEMIVWGSSGPGLRYRPSTDVWVPVNAGPDAPEPRYDHEAVWTGSEMLIWGGRASEFNYLRTGARYDPLIDSWSPMNGAVNVPAGRAEATAVWTGREMIVWGGYNGSYSDGETLNTGGRYDPAADSWVPTGTGSFTAAARYLHSTVWTGSEMIVWGGFVLDGLPMSGARYDPATDRWQATSTGINVPDFRRYHTAVWTGREMIIWGGGAYSYSNTGSRYNPTTDTWMRTSTLANVPAVRQEHTAIWNGSEMIVWGGFNGSYLNTGGRYHPDTDTWTTTSTGANVPAPRRYHTAIWTGEEMIIWGGENASSTGSRYDPVADTWTPAGAADTFPWRFNHSAIWTGTEMIIWGGWTFAGATNTGGRYSPARDEWRPTSVGSNVPQGHASHSAVWTGTEMIVWGGWVYGYNQTGGRYDPHTDSWTSTSLDGNVPSKRSAHSAVWTGREMLIWGGIPITYSGAGYCASSRCSVRSWYRDADGDGYGNDGDKVLSCAQPEGYLDTKGDCNDRDPVRHPGAHEVCNGLDDNCNESIDDPDSFLCNDDNVCTDDVCRGLSGCENVQNTAPCDDANACTVADSCGEGVCHSGRALVPKIDCNDGNACTRDLCDPDTGCFHAPVICRDGNPRTIDSCEPTRGCVFREPSAELDRTR